MARSKNKNRVTNAGKKAGLPAVFPVGVDPGLVVSMNLTPDLQSIKYDVSVSQMNLFPCGSD